MVFSCEFEFLLCQFATRGCRTDITAGAKVKGRDDEEGKTDSPSALSPVKKRKMGKLLPLHRITPQRGFLKNNAMVSFGVSSGVFTACGFAMGAN